MPPYVAKYRGQQLTDNAGNFRGECLSLVKWVSQHDLGLANADNILHAVNGAAKDLWYYPQPIQQQYYDKVSEPQVNDIAVYTNGTYGDVCFYIGNGQVFGQLGTPVFQPAAVRAVGSPAGYLRRKDSMPTLADATDVKAMYQSVLGRSADEIKQDEIDSQVGKEFKTLYYELLASKERSDLTNLVITCFFKGALQRTPSNSDLVGWSKYGLKDQAVGITNSAEAAQVTQYYEKGKGK